MSKLTTREKKLLYILLLALILVVGGRYLVFPFYLGYTESRGELSKLQNIKITEDFSSTLLSAQKDELQLKENDLKIKKSYIPDHMDNESIDKFVTGLMTQSGMSPISLQIGTSSALTTEITVPTIESHLLQSDGKFLGETASEPPTMVIPAESLEIVEVKITASSDESSMIRFIKNVDLLSYMVASVTNANMEIEPYALDITLQIYMKSEN